MMIYVGDKDCLYLSPLTFPNFACPKTVRLCTPVTFIPVTLHLCTPVTFRFLLFLLPGRVAL